jgi:hypothetical protein
MRWLVLIVMLFVYSVAFCHPRDSARVAEKKKAKIERKRERIMNRWDERSLEQRKNDRRALLFLAISAGILVNTLASKHE